MAFESTDGWVAFVARASPAPSRAAPDFNPKSKVQNPKSLSLLLLALAAAASHASVLHEWTFDDPPGTELNHTANGPGGFEFWTQRLANSATTGEGTFRIQRNGGTQNTRFDIGDTGGADRLFLVATIAGWDFSNTGSSNPYIRFSFMNGLAADTPSEITAEAILTATNAGTVTLQARALGPGGTSSSSVGLFPERQSEPVTIVVAYRESANHYQVFYRVGLEPWTSFYTGSTSGSRTGPSARILVFGDFDGGGANFLDLDRVTLTTQNPGYGPPLTTALNAPREESGGTWNLGGNQLAIGSGAEQTGELHVLNGGSAEDFYRLSLGTGGATASGVVTITGNQSVLAGLDGAAAIIGDHGAGSIAVSQGGSLRTGPATIGRFDSSTGNISVYGPGSTWQTGNANVLLGKEPGSSGAIEILDGALASIGRTIIVGERGSGSLAVTGGGALLAGHSIHVGTGTGADGQVEISGTGSLVDLGADLRIGAHPSGASAGAETASVRIAGEAILQTAGRVLLRNGGSLKIESGGTLVAGRGLDMGGPGNGGTLDIAGGALLADGPLDLNGAGGFSWSEGILEARDLVSGLNLISSYNTLRLIGSDAFFRNNSSQPILLEPGASIQGTGTIFNPVHLGSDGTGSLRGLETGRLRVIGNIIGKGTLERVRVNGSIAPDAGAKITVHDVTFAEGTTVAIDIPAGTSIPKLAFDETSDFSNARLQVRFTGSQPSEHDRFDILEFPSEGWIPPAFQAIHLPGGWDLDKGTLYYSGAAPVDTYDRWTAAHGLSGADAEPDADPNGSGRDNRAEFFFGGNPVGPSEPFVLPERRNHEALLRWRQRTAGDTVYALLSSEDLVTWNPETTLTPSPSATFEEPSPHGYRWTEVDVAGEAKQAFFRVTATEAPEPYVYPGETWNYIDDPEAEGVPAATIAECLEMLNTMDTTGFMAVKGGRVLFDYGDLEFVSYLASVRKSVIAMLYGRYVESGDIDLFETLEQIGIDDNLGLLPIERQATVHDLLRARSGVYHPRSNTGDNWDQAPPRGSQIPGNYYLYNNWDFNALGTIFTVKTGKTPYEAIETDFARPLRMQDYSLDAQRWGGNMALSEHRPYHFYLSTRDMARIAYLMLRGGVWEDERILPEGWAEHILHPWTPSHEMNPASRRSQGRGYGYLWWLREVDEDSPYYGSYAGHGAGGQYIMVIPKLDLALAHKTNSAGTSLSVSRAQFYNLADILVQGMTQ